MDDNNPNRNRPNEPNDNGWSWSGIGAAAVAGIAAVAGGVYLATRSSAEESERQSRTPIHKRSSPDTGMGGHRTQNTQQNGYSTFNLLGNILSALNTSARNMPSLQDAISRSEVPITPNITNLDTLLTDIYKRYVALKKEDFQLHYKVFTKIFEKLHNCMKNADKYYERYSSNIQFAGSHFDKLRIKKPDEFDMDIVIRLPVTDQGNPFNPGESDIIIEPKFVGYVQLRAGVQFQNILIRDGVDCLINRTAHKWMDDRKYILRKKFTDWFKGVGNRGLNLFERFGGMPAMLIDGVWYTVETSSSGPAWTIIIKAPGFKLDVDLVPALRFPENRWNLGKGYKSIPFHCRRDYWMVVPKPNKGGQNSFDEDRSWRIAMQDQEKKLMYDLNHFKQGIRLLKKLRDTQGMKKIASYYIKTLFFLEIDLQPREFWNSSVDVIFMHMLRKLRAALDVGKIPYYWNRSQNLIDGLNPNILNEYRRKIATIVNDLEQPSKYKQAAFYLLTPDEYQDYKRYLY